MSINKKIVAVIFLEITFLLPLTIYAEENLGEILLELKEYKDILQRQVYDRYGGRINTATGIDWSKEHPLQLQFKKRHGDLQSQRVLLDRTHKLQAMSFLWIQKGRHINEKLKTHGYQLIQAELHAAGPGYDLFVNNLETMENLPLDEFISRNQSLIESAQKPQKVATPFKFEGPPKTIDPERGIDWGRLLRESLRRDPRKRGPSMGGFGK